MNEVERYLRSLYDSDSRIAVLLLRGDGVIQSVPSVNRVLAPGFQGYLHRMSDVGWNVYASQALLKPGATGRKREDMLEARTLWLDLDRGLDALGKVLTSDRVPKPTWVLQTSHDRYQLVWRTEKLSYEKTERYLRGMVATFGADPNRTDITSCLRLPGFANCKRGKPLVRPVRLEEV